MRLTIKLNADEEIKVPSNYNHGVQGFLYRNLSLSLGKFLHDEGLKFGKRRFKMFTFSRIFGKYKRFKAGMWFSPPISLVISSPIDSFIKDLGNSFISTKELELLGNKVYVEEIQIHSEPEIKDEIRIKMLSPVVVYSTLKTGEGKKKTYYYSPYEEEFTELIDENLRKKYQALYKKKPRARKLKIKRVGKPKEKVLLYRGTVIKGWTGMFILDGNRKLLKLAYDTGLGSKNSQGFGMFEIVE